MTNDLAARALQAHKAESEARAHEKEAADIRMLQQASDAIWQTASEEYGIRPPDNGVAWEILVVGYRRCGLSIPVTDDATLYFEWAAHTDPPVSVCVKPSDQLYWDLEPGVEVKPPGGGVYGCFGLSSDSLAVKSLAGLGAVLARVEAARAIWQRNHGAER